jgi:ribosomal protein L37AE/L43A
MTDHVKPDRPLEEYECPECGRDCGQQVKGEVGTCWHFYCEHCGIDFGGDL